ncbi:MAG TPA: hypothetical protein VNG71_04195, partial [Pyrinomonadaceae bacterium]|nr:hypothetical protein [Pyrinomonadaceae bacterium]
MKMDDRSDSRLRAARHDANLFQAGRALIVGFQLFRINILTRTQNNDFFLPAGDRKLSAIV